MFRLLGTTVELIKYTIGYIDNGVNRTENCISEEHKNEVQQSLSQRGISFSTENIDQTGNKWFNGLKFNSYDEALEVFNKGELAYKAIISPEDRIKKLETQNANLDETAVVFFEENEKLKRSQAEQDDSIIALYENIGGTKK